MLNRRIFGVDEFGGRSLHLYGFRRTTDTEFRVDATGLTPCERVPRAAEGLKARLFDIHPVGAKNQGRRAVVAGAVCADDGLNAGLLVGNSDPSAWNGSYARL